MERRNQTVPRWMGLILNAGEEIQAEIFKRFRYQKPGDKIYCFPCVICASDGRELGLYRSRPALLFSGMTFPHNFMFVPSGIYKKVGLYKEIALSMDYEWVMRCKARFGVKCFKEEKTIAGRFYLGGISDTKYIQGFAQNYSIAVSYGVSRPVAASVFCVRILNHWFRKWWRRR